VLLTRVERMSLSRGTMAYPEIEEEVAASEELVDLAAGGFDAGIRLGQFISPDMVQCA
jgi:DNA-binding transcriptional LysR family regulator